MKTTPFNLFNSPSGRNTIVPAKRWFLIGILLLLTVGVGYRAAKAQPANTTIKFGNEKIACVVEISGGQLQAEKLSTRPEWSARYHTAPLQLQLDGDFALNVMWTGWRAPGRVNNSENPVIFTARDFRFLRKELEKDRDGNICLRLYFRGTNNPFDLRLTYCLERDAFFLKRRVSIRDTVQGLHFLRKMGAREGRVENVSQVVKTGGYGQPVALLVGDGGAFAGMEYPTAENNLQFLDEQTVRLSCSRFVGKKIESDWLESEWVVVGLTPNPYLKQWFARYLETLRVAPLRPYLLYNTWYDLRAPEMVQDSLNILNESNIRRIIGLFRKNMVEKYDLRLDAFVLDDGWDVYRSDWVLRKKEFPHGLKPLAEELARDGTRLGIWFGPIGGYSHRDWRINWMKSHGYEVVGDQLCLAGRNYSQLFKKRVTAMVKNQAVAYFKWDGIQFSCSEADHGHPVGIYSRRAVMDSTIAMCQAVREANPEVFLNITSGTWLSPWWLKYANQIWMQGYDYGYADVPSISRRDAAITYRDFVLYDDLVKQDFWFPIANLMTHGIIKGHLQKLGGEREPLDKFTDNALLYVARGVSMWELYISPDLLTEGEWQAIARSIRWAKDRFEVLKHTEMVGGDPGKRQPYGYLHAAGTRIILAARNPFIRSQVLRVKLDPAAGVDERAASLVLERIYPTHWVAPQLYAAGAVLEIPLQGYETAVYELYPLEEATHPLLGGATYRVASRDSGEITLEVLATDVSLRLLNPEKIRRITVDGQTVPVLDLKRRLVGRELPEIQARVEPRRKKNRLKFSVHLKRPAEAQRLQLAVLLEPQSDFSGQDLPLVTAKFGKQSLPVRVEKQDGKWSWTVFDLLTGSSEGTIRLEQKGKKGWKGQVSLWLIADLKPAAQRLNFELEAAFPAPQPQPPSPWDAGMLKKNFSLGEFPVDF